MRSAQGKGGSSAVDSKALIDRIDDLLPQTQCARCGYSACRPYAEAMALGQASINRCPPGGERTIAALSKLLETPALALDPECGEAEFPPPIASIIERACIGCTLCIPACPVDAIIGARRWMHSVLDSRCTGCGLCIDPCPMDCIRMIPRLPPLDEPEDSWRERWERYRQEERAPEARRNHRRHLEREENEELSFRKRQKRSRLRPPQSSISPKGSKTPRRGSDTPLDIERRRAVIAASLERERARRFPTKEEPYRHPASGEKA